MEDFKKDLSSNEPRGLGLGNGIGNGNIDEEEFGMLGSMRDHSIQIH